MRHIELFEHRGDEDHLAKTDPGASAQTIVPAVNFDAKELAGHAEMGDLVFC